MRRHDGRRHVYHGNTWRYWLGGGSNRPCDGSVELSVPTSNYREDEAFARYLVRQKLGVKSLPPGTRLYPTAWL